MAAALRSRSPGTASFSASRNHRARSLAVGQPGLVGLRSAWEIGRDRQVGMQTDEAADLIPGDAHGGLVARRSVDMQVDPDGIICRKCFARRPGCGRDVPEKVLQTFFPDPGWRRTSRREELGSGRADVASNVGEKAVERDVHIGPEGGGGLKLCVAYLDGGGITSHTHHMHPDSEGAGPISVSGQLVGDGPDIVLRGLKPVEQVVQVVGRRIGRLEAGLEPQAGELFDSRRAARAR